MLAGASHCARGSRRPFELSRVDLAANQQNSTEYFASIRRRVCRRSPMATGSSLRHQRSCVTLRRGIPRPGFGPGIRAKKRAAPNGSIGCRRPFRSLSLMSGARRVTPPIHAQSRMSPPPVKRHAANSGRRWTKRSGEGPWAIGERYSVADPLMLVYWTWGRGPVLGFDMEREFPRWTAHARRLATRPAVQRAFASEGLTLPA